MPTVLRIGAARFFFFSNEGFDPPHVHIEQAGALARFWLDLVASAASSRFSGHDLRRLEKQVIEHRKQLIQARHDYFRP